ncbi:hypothetical protein AVEN_219367-1 [Araneus ventricosus]|uniref:Uncharacterized protein n=1 Tax=Araneus ventricosus TaxID=182803 RepID=A0A4Y2BHD9_ARAVE|nr:hypothetical protein AVEN_219367-1 [Araneus ventricosus]
MFYNIFDTVPERPVGNTDNLYFVLDGGCLIHRVVWPKQETFGDVYTTYMSYIKRHYGHDGGMQFHSLANNREGCEKVEAKMSNVLPLVWFGSLEKECQIRCRPRHLTTVQNDEVRPKIALVLLQDGALLKLS